MMPQVQEEYDAIQEYYSTLRAVKEEFLNAGLTEEEFMNLLDYETDNVLSAADESKKTIFTWKNAALIFFGLLVSFVVGANYQVIYRCLACNCNVQDYIYPVLRLLRKVFIPIISLFPSLTSLYHESCLIQNPFFVVSDMDCWPCSTVDNIMEVYKPKNVNEQQKPPFIYKTEQNAVTLTILKDYYLGNKNTFDKGAPQILIDNKHYIHPTEMFYQLDSGEKHTYVWKLNSVNEAKSLRQLIPRPEVVPRFGQSTERYLIIDTSQEQIQIPDTECNFSFILSLSGFRTVEMRPAEECKHQCKSLKINLKQTYLLWYNWWYWRPVVQSALGNTTFIAHVGSYC